MTARSWGVDGLKATRERPWDIRSLRRVRVASIIGLAAGIAGVAVLELPQVTGVFTVSTGMSGPTVSLALPTLLGVYFAAVIALGLLQILLYRSGFHILSEVSGDFSTPSTLAIVALIGVVLVVVGFALFLYVLVQAINCAGSGNPLTSACLVTGTFWGSVAALLVGAVVALVGYIGILIGIWRLGSRFDSSLFKVAAVLLIFPYLSLVGQILILIGTTQEIGRPQ